MDKSWANQQIGYILRSYPRLTQTFILNEVLGLEELGVPLALFPLARSGESLVQPGAERVHAPVQYLEDANRRPWRTIFAEHLRMVLHSPAAYLKTGWYVLSHKELDEGYKANTRFENFKEAVYLAAILREDERRTGRKTVRLHAHFAHDPALVAYLTHRLTGIPFSFTAHARDLYQVPVRALVERATKASAVVTCCGANQNYLQELIPAHARSKIQLVHHGLDLQGIHPADPQDHSPQGAVPLILSAGRLVEKKGFSDLLQALARLKQDGIQFKCRIYGDGPLQKELAAQIVQLGLQGEVCLAGAYTQSQIMEIFSQAALFALTPIIPPDGDRDGIPNVLIEAMACGVPVVSTAVAGIPELVRHGQNGFLSPAHDVAAIKTGMQTLLCDEALRQQIGAAARETVCAGFDQRISAKALMELFSAAT